MQTCFGRKCGLATDFQAGNRHSLLIGMTHLPNMFAKNLGENTIDILERLAGTTAKILKLRCRVDCDNGNQKQCGEISEEDLKLK